MRIVTVPFSGIYCEFPSNLAAAGRGAPLCLVLGFPWRGATFRCPIWPHWCYLFFRRVRQHRPVRWHRFTHQRRGIHWIRPQPSRQMGEVSRCSAVGKRRLAEIRLSSLILLRKRPETFRLSLIIGSCLLNRSYKIPVVTNFLNSVFLGRSRVRMWSWFLPFF